MNPSNQPEPKKPICADAWAIPPSPRMLKNGNDYYTCSTCGEPCDVIDLKPNAQADLIDFVTDPETIAKAVEGSMDKRMAVQAEVGLREQLRYLKVDVWASGQKLYVNLGTVLDMQGLDEITALFQADKAAAVVEAKLTAIEHLRNEQHIFTDEYENSYGSQEEYGIAMSAFTEYEEQLEAELARLQPPTASEGESV